jgi:hypothetical protein
VTVPTAMFDRQFHAELGETCQPVVRPSFDSPTSIIQVVAIRATAAGLVQLLAAKELSNNFHQMTAVFEIDFILTAMENEANSNTRNKKNYSERN